MFQSYNLIPHQTVLQNVELSLTLSGVSKGERRKRAKEALERVVLATQLNKKPSEMSGALDTETSVQVMEILKEIKPRQ